MRLVATGWEDKHSELGKNASCCFPFDLRSDLFLVHLKFSLYLAQEKGFLKDGKLLAEIKAGQIVDWLKEEYELGHGHAMAIYAYFKGKRS